MSTFINKHLISNFADACINQDLSFFKSLDTCIDGENYYEEIEEYFQQGRIKKSGLSKYYSRLHNEKISSKLLLSKLREYNYSIFNDDNAVGESSGEKYYRLPKNKYRHAHNTTYTTTDLEWNENVFVPFTRAEEIEYENTKRRDFIQALINKNSSYFTKKLTGCNINKDQIKVFIEALPKGIIPIEEFCAAYLIVISFIALKKE